MKIMKLILIAMSLVIFASCAEDSESPTGSKSLDVEVGEYSPAKVGSYWKYEINQNGMKSEATMTAVGTKDLVGQTWVEYETEQSGQKALGYTRFDNGKYYSLILDGTTTIIGDLEFLAVDENADIGDKWDVPTKVRMQGSAEPINTLYEIEVEDKLSSYEVRGKKYDNVIAMYLKLSVNFFGQEIHLVNQIYYYASGIGVIKVVGVGSNITYTQELVEYKE